VTCTLRLFPGRVRGTVIGAGLATLLILPAPGRSVQAIEYDFESAYSIGAALSQSTIIAPSVNSAGAIAFAALVFDPAANRSAWIVFRGDGSQFLPVLNLTETLGVGSPSSLVNNDAGAIAVSYISGAEAGIARINADGSVVVLARADQLGSAPYLEFPTTISMNTTGQVAALVTNPDSTSSIVGSTTASPSRSPAAPPRSWRSAAPPSTIPGWSPSRPRSALRVTFTFSPAQAVRSLMRGPLFRVLAPPATLRSSTTTGSC